MDAADTVTCIDVFGTQHQTPRSELQWRPAAYAIVLRNDTSQVLLLRQFGDKHELPGGGITIGENPSDAAIREVKEETGLDVRYPTLLGVESYLFRSTHSDNRSFHSLLMYYVCEFVGGEISNEGWDEHERKYVDVAEWVDLDRLSELKVGGTVDFRPYVALARGGGGSKKVG